MKIFDIFENFVTCLPAYNLGKNISRLFHVLAQFSSRKVKRNYNPGQNIWNKIEKFSKIGQGKESFISTFAYFLTAIAEV